MEPYNEIIRALRHLGSVCNALVPSKIIPEPNEQDAKAIIGDLAILGARVDAVIEAYGKYVSDFVTIDKQSFVEGFKDILSRKLEDCTFFHIEAAISEHVEAMHEDMMEHKR